MQAQEKASEREERRKAGSPVEAGSWAWNEEFHDCHRFPMKRYPGRRDFLNVFWRGVHGYVSFFIYQMD